MAGWGTLSSGGNTPDKAQHVTVPAVPECAETGYGNQYKDPHASPLLLLLLHGKRLDRPAELLELLDRSQVDLEQPRLGVEVEGEWAVPADAGRKAQQLLRDVVC